MERARRTTNTILFFFNDTATTEIYTLSLHDALPISIADSTISGNSGTNGGGGIRNAGVMELNHVTIENKDRKSTRLNSSHANISYAVFCLKKKKHTFK